MQCRRRELTKLDPDTTAMRSQKVAAQQAAAQGSVVC